MRIPRTEIPRIEPLNRLLSRPSATLSSIRNGGKGREEEVPGFMGREKAKVIAKDHMKPRRQCPRLEIGTAGGKARQPAPVMDVNRQGNLS